jgi:hypothetical protein
MRPILLAAMLFAAVLTGRAAAQVAPPDNGVPSVLAPRMPEALPPPTPIAPETNAAPIAAVPPAASDRGMVTAIPLPPPDAGPASVPPVAAPPATMSTTGAPVASAPISLAPPRPELGVVPPGVGADKQGAKIAPAALASNKLPEPPLSPEASPVDFLRAARGALAAGRAGEARSALEMAQTRLLDRVVDAGKEQEPSHDAAVKQITGAINALAANDRMTCLRYIEFASQTLGSPLD